MKNFDFVGLFFEWFEQKIPSSIPFTKDKNKDGMTVFSRLWTDLRTTTKSSSSRDLKFIFGKIQVSKISENFPSIMVLNSNRGLNLRKFGKIGFLIVVG